MKKQIIDNKNPLIKPFISNLGRALEVFGCMHDFRFTNFFLGAIEYDFKILIDREQTINFFMDNGGCCDCEIMLNISCNYEEDITQHENIYPPKDENLARF